ncbi:hypothetical protein FO519_010872 [Halicephalobus sp. NKZ332]|nr:hypothetical protein FO519_010872 [Halicephalobus sp. NKZ332]
MKFLLFTTLIGLTATIAFLGTKPKGLMCTICQDLVNDLEQEVENDEGDIEGKAEKICDKMTKNSTIFDPLCKSLVDKEIDKIIQGIKNNDPPLRICQDVDCC